MNVELNSFCSGALIDKHWVLTSAFCVDGVRFFKVYLGAFDISLPDEPGRIARKSRVAYLHEEYNFDNNIGVVYLPEAVELNGECPP